MKNLLLALLIGVSTYQAWLIHFSSTAGIGPAPETCACNHDNGGWTQKKMQELDETGIEYLYSSIGTNTATDRLR